MLMDCLQDLEFDTRTFLISPTQLGVPNSRLRCYIIARRHRQLPETLDSNEIITDLCGIQAYIFATTFDFGAPDMIFFANDLYSSQI